MLKLLARTNTLPLNTTLNRTKLRDILVCEARPYNAPDSLQHSLLECPAYKNIRDQSFQEIVERGKCYTVYLLWHPPIRKLMMKICIICMIESL